jgi:hypothetical protein
MNPSWLACWRGGVKIRGGIIIVVVGRVNIVVSIISIIANGGDNGPILILQISAAIEKIVAAIDAVVSKQNV